MPYFYWAIFCKHCKHRNLPEYAGEFSASPQVETPHSLCGPMQCDKCGKIANYEVGDISLVKAGDPRLMGKIHPR
jgi:hypothetical protein